MWRVLVVEDSLDSQRLVTKAIGSECRLQYAETAAEALRALESARFDLILLDVGLPDGNGFEICSLLQNEERTRGIPVVFLTARGDTQDVLHAFSLGADDFVEKPFDVRELRARVRARLRKAEGASETLWRGELRIDVPHYRAALIEAHGERDLGLTPNEFRLLYQLASQERRVLSREQLRSSVWGDTVVGDRTIDSHLSNVRKKLGDRGGSIESVRGVGYRYVTREEGTGDAAA